jgi:hypothetical protein
MIVRAADIPRDEMHLLPIRNLRQQIRQDKLQSATEPDPAAWYGSYLGILQRLARTTDRPRLVPAGVPIVSASRR